MPRWIKLKWVSIASNSATSRTRRVLAGLVACAILVVGTLTASPASAVPQTITNGTQFTTTTGAVVHAHGGGMIKVGAYFYWVGENRNLDDTFKAVSMYRSTDLKSWEFRGDILTQASSPELASAKIERPKLLYNSSTGQFVLWMHKENATDYVEARVAVATSTTIEGAYSYQGSFRPLGFESRDLTVFSDSDGSAYLISATNLNKDLNIYKLNSSYTGIQTLVQTLWAGQYREAPAMFKRGSTYFLLTSGATGWTPNQAKFSTATSVSGVWTQPQNFGDSTAFGSQAAFVIPVQGTQATSYLYLGDRWAGANGQPANNSTYVWLPLTFPSATSVSMSDSSTISIDTDTGIIGGSGAVAVDDGVLGTGLNQFNYSGSWGHASGDSGPFNGTNSYSNVTGNTASLTFSGTSVAYYTVKASNHGIVAVSIDGGAETLVDLYAATRAGDQLVWSSPTLASGAHTFTVRVTGTKNASSTATYGVIDRVNVFQ